MKRFILVFCTVALCSILHAQDSVRVSLQKPQLEDVLSVLEMNGTYIYRFDLQSLQNTCYNVTFYIDEYRHAEKQQRVHSFLFGPNIGSIKDFPEEDWAEARRLFDIAPGEFEYVSLPTVTLTFQVKDDSLAYINASSPKLGSMGKSFKLYPVVPAEGDAFYQYATRPFRQVGLSDADTMEIPLVFYGSAWYDAQSHFTRFCGENEIDPAMQAQIVKDVPHAYVVGMRLEKMQAEAVAE